MRSPGRTTHDPAPLRRGPPDAPRIAIVGTRQPTAAQIARVFDLVAGSPSNATIISGGAPGIDSYARAAAHLYRRAFVEYLPELHDGMTWWEEANAKHERNGRVVRTVRGHCDGLMM